MLKFSTKYREIIWLTDLAGALPNIHVFLYLSPRNALKCHCLSQYISTCSVILKFIGFTTSMAMLEGLDGSAVLSVSLLCEDY